MARCRVSRLPGLYGVFRHGLGDAATAAELDSDRHIGIAGRSGGVDSGSHRPARRIVDARWRCQCRSQRCTTDAHTHLLGRTDFSFVSGVDGTMAVIGCRQRHHVGPWHDCGAVLLHARPTGSAQPHCWSEHPTRRDCRYRDGLCCAGSGSGAGGPNRQCWGNTSVVLSSHSAVSGRSDDDATAVRPKHACHRGGSGW